MVVATVAVLMDVICKKLDSFGVECSHFSNKCHKYQTAASSSLKSCGTAGGCAPTGDLLKLLQDELDNLKTSDMKEVREVGLNIINALSQPSTVIRRDSAFGHEYPDSVIFTSASSAPVASAVACTQSCSARHLLVLICACVLVLGLIYFLASPAFSVHQASTIAIETTRSPLFYQPLPLLI